MCVCVFVLINDIFVHVFTPKSHQSAVFFSFLFVCQRVNEPFGANNGHIAAISTVNRYLLEICSRALIIVMDYNSHSVVTPIRHSPYA